MAQYRVPDWGAPNGRSTLPCLIKVSSVAGFIRRDYPVADIQATTAA
jgi:hypothetical protein